ncbi:MAG TPA: hypothetical protein VGG72_12165 [Bryobacteraceae bacterium]|jgi:hypothetical protein
MLKQPALGLVASALVIAISLGFVALFPAAKFLGSVTYCLICIIPMEIVIGVMWGCKQPAFAAKRSQPAKGGLLMLLAAMVGLVVIGAYFFTVGGGVRPISPMLMICTIVSVIVTFWAAIIWGGWPFTAWIKNPVAAGLAMLTACYVVNYLLFRLFFNYDFMRGAPVYVPSLDPHGLFNANLALVFYMSAIGVMFLMLHFDLWPLTLSPSLMKQPVLGLVWTAICLVLGAIAFYVGVFVMAIDPLRFMVLDPIPFIFGTIIVLNMLQGSLFAKFQQPLKGTLSALTAAVIGTGLALLYGALAPTLSGELAPGPPGNDFERWLASALLGVTFPFLIFYAEFFEFWPLKKPGAAT